MSNLKQNPAENNETIPSAAWLFAAREIVWSRIFGGVVFPALLTITGLYCIITQQGILIGRGIHKINGPSAIGLGIALLGAALFTHTHFFWTPFHRILIISELGRIVGALTFIVGFLFMFWAMFWM